MSTPVWLITGTSHGFGLLLALRALRAGHRVVGTMRSLTSASAADAARQIADAGGRVVEMDMTESQEGIGAKVREAEAVYGRVDYLVNNAGMSLLGSLEHFTEEEFIRQYRTNVFGPLFTIQAVLPGMRSRRSGQIVNLSSVGGQDSLATSGAYGSSKFALEGLSESLAKEVAPFGISVLIVEPGAFRTNFLAASVLSALPDAYRETPVEAVLAKFRAMDGAQVGDPVKAVERLFEVVAGEGVGGRLTGKVLRLPLGMDAFDRIDAKTKKLLEDLAAAKELELQASTAFQ